MAPVLGPRWTSWHRVRRRAISDSRSKREFRGRIGVGLLPGRRRPGRGWSRRRRAPRPPRRTRRRPGKPQRPRPPRPGPGPPATRPGSGSPGRRGRRSSRQPAALGGIRRGAPPRQPGEPGTEPLPQGLTPCLGLGGGPGGYAAEAEAQFEDRAVAPDVGAPKGPDASRCRASSEPPRWHFIVVMLGSPDLDETGQAIQGAR